MVIYKLIVNDLEINKPFVFHHSVGGRVLKVDDKDGEISIWYMTSKSLQQDQEVDIRFVMTGEECNPYWKYINTFKVTRNNFTYVFHTFQV